MSTEIGVESRSGALPHVVIIGGGFGGLRVARNLKDAPVHVTLVDRSNHHLFQPLLYQVATAGLNPADIASPIRSILRKNENADVLLGDVQDIDAQRKAVLLPDRTLFYDYLIVATGASYNYFGHEEWETHAPPLKTIENATALRARILLAFEKAEMEPDAEKRKALLTFVVVGGGPTGVEMAGSIADLAHRALSKDFRHIDPTSARVLLVEAMPSILGAFPEHLAAKAQKKLESMGVDVMTGGMVKDITPDGVQINDAFLPAFMTMWAAGVKASPAGEWLGAETDKVGRVKVEPDLTVKGCPDVYVIGDTAACLDEDGKPLPGLAPVAIQQGAYVAKRIQRRARGVRQDLEEHFHYVNKGNLATVGRAYAILEIGKLRMTGFLAWLTWVVVHIFYLIGFRNRAIVMTQWFWAYLTFQRGARLIITAPPHKPEKPL